MVHSAADVFDLGEDGGPAVSSGTETGISTGRQGGVQMNRAPCGEPVDDCVLVAGARNQQYCVPFSIPLEDIYLDPRLDMRTM